MKMASTGPKRNEITVTPPRKSSAGSVAIDDDDDDNYMPAVFSWLSVEVPVFLFAFREVSRPEIEDHFQLPTSQDS